VTRYRNLAIAVAVGLLLIFGLFASLGRISDAPTRQISYSELVQMMDAGEVRSITISGEEAFGKLRDGSSFATTLLPFYSSDIVKQLTEKGVQVDARATQSDNALVTFLVYWLPFLTLIGVWIYFVRQIRAGFSKLDERISKARLASATMGSADVSHNDPTISVIVKRLPHAGDLPLPAYQSASAAGLDLCAADVATIEPGAHALIPTGFAIALPANHEAQIRPRSGLAASQGVTVLNSPGTIDADYRGEIKVILVNLGQMTVRIARGDRIAQMIVAPVSHATVVEVEELDPTARGGAGFGSSGKR
jgi:dUTP pyrophosphatase